MNSLEHNMTIARNIKIKGKGGKNKDGRTYKNPFK